MRAYIMYGIIIVILLVLLGEVAHMQRRIGRIHTMMYDLDMAITRGAMTGRVGEEVQ